MHSEKNTRSRTVPRCALNVIAEMRQTDWRPILAEHLIDLARDSVHSVTTELVSREQKSLSPSELCDIALTCAYLEAAEPSSGWGDRALDYLNTAASQVSAEPISQPGLFGGLAGCGWAFEHISKMLGDEQAVAESEDPIADIDVFLHSCLRKLSWTGNYEVVSGLVGIGVYFLERMPRTSAAAGIELVISRLLELSENSWGGTTWYTPPQFISDELRKSCPAGYYNLGVAHGVPGVAAFLGQVIAAGLEVPGCRDLLHSTVQWIMAQQRPPTALSRYDSWFVPGRPPEDSRLGWCYGDLGLCAVLYQTAFLVGREDWRDFARLVFDHSLKRTAQDGWIVDQGLCHGSLSVAHIHNRMHQMTGDKRYFDSANVWYEHALRTREPGIGIAGFYAYRTDRTPNHQPDVSFLSGASGVALALISAMHPVEPAWDRLLFLSGRSGSKLVV